MIYLFTDGSCYHKDRLGTWGALVATKNSKKLLFGMTYETTISRMELIPMIEGLRWIYREVCHQAKGHKVHVVSDSLYTVKCMSGIDEPSKNLDMWEAFWHWKSLFNLTAEWRGRNTEPAMEICDSTAYALRTYIKENLYKGLTEYPLDFSHES